MRFLIEIALLIQGGVSKLDVLAGSIVGYLLTTGILIWGLTVYNNGNGMTFFGFKLEQPVFWTLCGIWYTVDTYQLVRALNKRKVSNKAIHSGSISARVVSQEHTRELESASAEGSLSSVFGDRVTTVTCPECGYPNPRFSSNCGRCGESLG